MERDIKKSESKKVELQAKFADSSLSGEEIAALSIELGELSETINQKTERWFELSAMMEG